MKNNLGTQFWTDGSKYIGEWCNSQAHGKGILFHADGDIYDGIWKNDKPNGQGKYKNITGVTY
jgi:hypothetical protein